MERVGLGVREVVFSDYIIYADESGDPNPVSVDPNYPVFVLNFCVFRKHDYAASVLPAVAAFKFEHFGHDAVVLHENDIHMRRPPFVFLRDEQRRALFMDRLDWLVRQADFTIIAAAIDKRGLEQPHDLYEIALRNCMERTYGFLKNRGERKRTTHIIIEGRGSKEDRQLTEAFRRIRRGENSSGQTLPGLDIVFADKKANSAGLQIADLTARPIGRHFIDPHQPNRAWNSLESKLLRSPQGDVDGWGLTVLPK
jgi:hypothetical protein